ncbi:leucine-rich repeat and calponin homology domain-containing protein 4 isoform X2 [Candoia aspera]|uniref:leucine-rich repeat and calponin homology domain-containing protein 4 isoform X2 n=1 Tax=Candoia aspera TaxID=51853 RepID=UPI002FD8456F
MAAGEGGADSLPPPSPSLPGPLPGSERALEEAAASGSLSLAGRRLRHFPGGAARRWDLSDITQADLSRNRFAEVPEDACHLMSLEGLSLYHNCLRSLPPAIANLQALTYLNISRNQISALPSCLCRLPLKVLIASNNKLASLPDDIGSLSSLRQLDVSSNELQSLPGGMGSLESLRDLNIRRNQITVLPEELAELPLVRLDFSCNLIARLPVCFRHLRHLQCILLENNPLQFPPAQVCLKGKIHIFKYLNIEACSKARSDLAEFAQGRPTGFGTCLPEDFYPARQHGGLDSGFHSVDSGSKRWSGNESTDEFSDLSFRIAELARDPKQLKEKRGGAADASELEQIDYIDSSVNGEEEEEEEEVAEEEGTAPPPLAGRAGKAWPGFPGTASHEEHPKPARSFSQRAGAAAEPGATGRSSGGASLPRPELSAEERRRPELLQLWQERERQQQQRPLWPQGTEKPDSSLVESSSSSSSSLSQLRPCSQGAEPLAGSPKQSPHCADPLLSRSSTAANPGPREAGSVHRPSSFLFRSSSQQSIQRSSGSRSLELGSPLRSRAGSQALDEQELLSQLRKAIESRLNVTLAEDLGEALADGVILCQLANQLCPRSVPFIHVPSPAVPKLNALKSRKNVQSFLAACHQLGIPEADLCCPRGGLDDEDLPRLAATVQALLETDRRTGAA